MNNESQLLIKQAPVDSILRLVMNDQNSKNALSNKMISALMNAIAFANNDNSIKVIVIASKGNVYSAGHDLVNKPLRPAVPQLISPSYQLPMGQSAQILSSVKHRYLRPTGC